MSAELENVDGRSCIVKPESSKAHDEDRHVERLARLESTISGMRDFLSQRMKSAPAGSRTSRILIQALEHIRVIREDIAEIKRTDRTWRVGQKKMVKLRNVVWDTFERLQFSGKSYADAARLGVERCLVSTGCQYSFADLALALAPCERPTASAGPSALNMKPAQQNPTDCQRARKLRCTVNNPWGFGSGVHDVLWCFVAALQMGRTLILDTSKWHITPESHGWSSVFQPLAGSSCENVGIDKDTVIFNTKTESRTETRRKILDLPTSIIGTLVANHADPYAWWYGQIMGYILRLQDSTRQRIENFKRQIGYQHPIVS
ncbi:hypothetical protein HPB50_011398 [Hyalomma asiaticum]|uniref:Uncharacterized protein n=1 Tax=Hyalomma asiaticum TaxID=266040 RepID=A0ACB7S5Y6_HYAAI|nr:hypothetical protein HPB50_011398 [Hyalomma asiaticum]